MFILEKDLNDGFSKIYLNYYKKNGSLIYYEHELEIERPIDLVTVENYQSKYQINAFEFKLSDVKKAIAQAEFNSRYVNKSWIVLPKEKENLIRTRYYPYLKEKKYIGVMCVNVYGGFEIIYQPMFNNDVKLHQNMIRFLLRKE